MKQEEKSLATRKKIITVATRLFLDKGYEHATMQDIMTEGGLTKGAIYHHFSSKQEILEEMIQGAQSQINTFFEELAENGELTVKEKVANIIQYFIANERQELLIRNKWVEKVPFALLNVIRNGNDFIAREIAIIIEQGIKNGEFHCEYPTELAEVLILLLDVWLDPVITKRNHIELNKRLDFVCRLLEHFKAPLFDEIDISTIKKLYSNYRE